MPEVIGGLLGAECEQATLWAVRLITRFAALECRNQLEIGHKSCSVHGSIKYEGRDHPATAEASHEGKRLPMPMRHMADQRHAARAAAAKPHHVG